MESSPDKSGARQFSLRKLFLWIGVCAVCLGVLRFAGARPIFAAVLTVCLAVILIAHLRWRLRGGMIAVSVISIGHVCFWVSISGPMPWNVQMEWSGIDLILSSIFLLSSTALIGLLALSCVDVVVQLVDRLDSLGRKPRPPNS
jgi:hypothetical protein